MLAYKFRGAENPQFTLDILKYNRLYCADWQTLNDPMEGTYDTLIVNPEKRLSSLATIREQKFKFRVCSLSDTYKSHAMWAYYASGFQGVAIEIEFIDESQLIRIDYASGSRIQQWAEKSDPYKIAREILSKKHSDWQQERELRLIQETSFFDLAPDTIKRVILGSRISEYFETQIRATAGAIPVQKLKMRSGDLKAQ
ncbi:hypothetical protein D3C87_321320 [compost metagenome]